MIVKKNGALRKLCTIEKPNNMRFPINLVSETNLQHRSQTNRLHSTFYQTNTVTVGSLGLEPRTDGL